MKIKEICKSETKDSINSGFDETIKHVF